METRRFNADCTPNKTVCCEATYDSHQKSKLVTGIIMKVSLNQSACACPLNRPWKKAIITGIVQSLV